MSDTRTELDDFEEMRFDDEETDIAEDDGEFFVDAPPLETTELKREIRNPFAFDTDEFLEGSGLCADIYQDFDVRRFIRKSFRQCIDYLGFEDDAQGEHSEERCTIVDIDDNDVRIVVKVTMTADKRCVADFGFYVNE